jgi:hypothetical protein
VWVDAPMGGLGGFVLLSAWADISYRQTGDGAALCVFSFHVLAEGMVNRFCRGNYYLAGRRV